MNTLVDTLPAEARARLDERARQVAADPRRIRALFPAAAREVARTPVSTDPGAPRLEDDVRGRLLDALAEALRRRRGRVGRGARPLPLRRR